MTKNDNKKAKYTIISLWLANELQEKGYSLLGVGYNFMNPKYKVFYFEDSDSLRREVSEIVKEKRNGKVC